MRTTDFNQGDKVMVKYTSYDLDTHQKKVENLITEIIVERRNRRIVIVDGEKAILKNYKKDNSVTGSTGMIRNKTGKSWLNFSVEVLGGLNYIREEKLKEIFS